MFTSTVIELDGPGEYRSDEVIFDRTGVYYWVETVTDAEGTILHRGICGAPDETTTVTDSPDEPGTPGTPGSLRTPAAVTGGRSASPAD